MPRPLFDSEYIFGFHDPGGEQLMLTAGRPGWVLFTEAIGHDPNDQSGADYSTYSNQGLGVMCRLNNGYAPDGTLPLSSQYANFAQRCANFVARTPGCKIWIIGNEMNYALERPLRTAVAAAVATAPLDRSSTTQTPSLLARVAQGIRTLVSGGQTVTQAEPPAPATTNGHAATNGHSSTTNGHSYTNGSSSTTNGSSSLRFSALQSSTAKAANSAFAAAADTTEVITPELYARCYRLCRDAIHAIPGHADDQVLVGAPAPWNNQTTYAGNPNGDWVQYFADILTLLGPTNCDGFTLHTYTHQANADLLTDETRMDPPFDNRRYQFRAYMDFMQAVPANMRQLPAYITETNEDEPWLERNIAWVQRAYGEIDYWNRQPGNQQIRALILYRWLNNIDRWGIAGKGAVIEDFQAALQYDYRWQASAVSVTPFQQGNVVETQDVVNLRRTPGYVGKPATDVLLGVPAQSRLIVLSSTPSTVDNLIWWNVQTETGNPPTVGWAAQVGPTGTPLLVQVQEQSMAAFTIGDRVRVVALSRLRRSPGYVNKAASDVVTSVAADTILTIAGGPSTVDGLTWWRVNGTGGASLDGWIAQVAPDGQTLLVRETPPAIPASFQVGDTVATLDAVRLRSTPGYVGKPATDTLATINVGVQGKIVSGPRLVDSLTWWQVQTTANGSSVTGWMAAAGPDGAVLLQRVAAPSPAPIGFAVGDLVVTTDVVRVRRSPGTNNKPANDVMGQFELRTTLNILEAPQSADGLTWWHVGGVTLTIGAITGWVAQRAPNDAVLLDWPPKLPGTNIPAKASGAYLAAPFQGHWGIAQLWGENPQVYASITYDGVPLKGHNGIDFLTPIGTPVQAVDAGVVSDAVLNDPTGFGNYIKLRHSWGESLYAHMDSLGVQQGQSIQRGTLLGRSGNTGFVDGPHLHFAIRINPYSRTDGWGGFSDPLPYMNPSDVMLPTWVLSSTVQSAIARQAAPVTHQLGVGYAPDKPGVRRP